MKWFDDFLSETDFSLTDKTDKSSLKNLRRPIDESLSPKTGHAPTDKTDRTPPRQETDPLHASMKRLEAAGISIAIWDDGSMRVIVSPSDASAAIKDKGTTYSPADMWYYIRLPQDERMVLHNIKRRFGGTVQWR